MPATSQLGHVDHTGSTLTENVNITLAYIFFSVNVVTFYTVELHFNILDEEEYSRMPRDSLIPTLTGGMFPSTLTTTSSLATSVASSALFNVPTIPAVPTAAAAMAAVVTSPLSPGFGCPPAPPPSPGAACKMIETDVMSSEDPQHLSLPKAMVASLSSETLTDTTISAPSSPSSIVTISTSTHTLVAHEEDPTTSHTVHFEEQEATAQQTPPPSPKIKISTKQSKKEKEREKEEKKEREKEEKREREKEEKEKKEREREEKEKEKEKKKEKAAMKGNLKQKEKEFILPVLTMSSSSLVGK